MIPLMKSAFLHEKQTIKALCTFLLDSPQLSMGPQCRKFEKAFAKFQGSKDAVLFNSGGSANLCMIQTLLNLGRLKKGDPVGFSALTWSTNVMPLIQLGLDPIPVDCDTNYLNVTVNDLKKTHKSHKLKAFFGTNVLGFAGNLDEIKIFCEEKGIVFIEDNCEGLGTNLNSGMTGSFGDMSSFSFFVAHHMSTIEGGMVCTNDMELSQMLRIVRANGWDRNLSAIDQHNIRKKNNIISEFDAKYTFYDLGYNVRPTEITGFIGNYQLQFLKENIKARESNFLKIYEIYQENPDLQNVKVDHLKTISNFSFPIIAENRKLREFYMQQFSGAGIEIRPMIAGDITRQPFFKKYIKGTFHIPNVRFLHECSFYFGNYPELTNTDIETIKSCIIKY